MKARAVRVHPVRKCRVQILICKCFCAQSENNLHCPQQVKHPTSELNGALQTTADYRLSSLPESMCEQPARVTVTCDTCESAEQRDKMHTLTRARLREGSLRMTMPYYSHEAALANRN